MRAPLPFFFLLATAVFGSGERIGAQSNDSIPALRRDLDSLRHELDDLRRTQALTVRELEAIRRLISDPRAAGGSPSAPKTIDGRGPSLGRATAPVTIVEFSDFECPFCGQFFRETLPLLVADYVNSGRVRFVYHDFPIASLHPGAVKAAEAARCAGDQSHFWEYHDALFQNQSSLEEAELAQRAATLKLDTIAFGRCLTSGQHANAIKRSIAEGDRAGVDGTPFFFIGTVARGTTTLRIANVIQGARPYAEFKEVIDRLLTDAARR
jgi:protein-disulfide isomerase